MGAGRQRAADLGLLTLALVLAGVLLWSAFAPPWGLFHDELYYWAGAQRFELGYVDHPPLASWILAVSLALFGDGPLGFAVVPAACGVGTVFVTGRLARTFGAGTFGQLLAGLAIAVVPIDLVFWSFHSVNPLELLLWACAAWIVAELARTGDTRGWLAFGAVAGVALLSKHTFLLFAFALGVGFALTPMRAQLRASHLWWGAALALLIAAPNLYWNAVNEWPSLAFYANRREGILDATVGEALEIHTYGMNPVNLLLWVPGLAWLLFARAGRPWRALGIAFAVLLAVILFAGQRRVDRMAGAYPIALAAGAVVWDLWRPRLAPLLRGVVVLALLASGIGSALGVLPILSPRGVVEVFEAIGEEPDIEVGDVGSDLPLFLAGRLEWDRFAAEALAAWDGLPAATRERAVLLAPHWVEASVIEYYGRDRDSLPVVAPHNAYAFWTDAAAGRDAVLAIHLPLETLAEHFEHVEELAVFRCETCTAFRTDATFRLATGPRRPLPELLAAWRFYGIRPPPALRADTRGFLETEQPR